ncbi:MAG TPA: acyl--CoA ligase [Pyrinomonadaceae bacterium]|nr:acyl--CoA ligase [Pyrinomonadaceae bacterium]
MILELLSGHNSSRLAVTVAGGPSLTYGQLRQQVISLAQELKDLEINRGDRIAIALPNGLEAIVAFLAASTAGTAAPLNPAYKQDEFRFYLADTSARALIVPANGMAAARQASTDETIIIETDIDADGQVRFRSDVHSSTNPIERESTPDDIALILHTSGTTSRPKRVPLAHKNLLASARNVAKTYALNVDDVALCVMPLFHVHGLVASTLATLSAGGTVVVAPRFDALSFWSTVREHQVTWYSAVPTIHQILLARTKGSARPSGSEQLRFIRSCSAALPAATMLELEDRFGVPVVEAYGMTEAAHQMTSNPLDGARKPGSVGCATGLEIAILDDAGQQLATGQRGEVCIKGPNVFSGYEDNPDANAASFTRGWFRTGDQGFLDQDGYLTLLGRIKELINRGGEKISPQEIDEVLIAHPSVSEAVCFAVPDRVYGEEVAAAVVLDRPETETGLIQHCRSLLADFKCPKVIHIVDAIPRTATGKIQRRNVAAAIAAQGKT